MVALACGQDGTEESDENGSQLPGSVCAPDAEGATSEPALAPNEFFTKIAVGSRFANPKLDADLPIAIDLPLKRYIGPFAATGTGGQRTLADYARVHTLGKYARLYLRVSGTADIAVEVLIENLHTGGLRRPLETYDPDASTSPHRPVIVPPVPVGPLRTVSVTFPTEQLALAPSKGVAASNKLYLHVKPRAQAAKQPPCSKGSETRIEWVALDFYAQAPIVLVHGINDTQKNCWTDYAAEMEQMGFTPDLEVDFSGLGDKPGLAGGPPTFNGSVAGDVTRIAQRLERLATDYGTNQVHLVGHSKGGLDLVNFLAGPYPAMAKAGRVRALSLQTLATPHAGSVLADIVGPLKQWAKKEEADNLSSWPSWGVVADDTTDTYVFDTVGLSGIKATVLENDGPIDPGLSDLRTTSEAVRIDQQWPGDPAIPFATYGWDADFERERWVNELAQLTTPPETPDQSGKYSTDCRGNPIGSRRWTYYCIDEDEVDTFFWGTAYYPPQGTSCSGWNVCGSPLYRQLARGRTATVTSAPMFGGSRSTIHVDPYGPGEWVGNDLTVALSSARHPRANLNVAFAGAGPRSIAGLWRFKGGGGAEPYVARCAHTGANHISILRHSRSDMVMCTAGDTSIWMRTSAPIVDEPPDAFAKR
jgi:hypothetical protein